VAGNLLEERDRLLLQELRASLQEISGSRVSICSQMGLPGDVGAGERSPLQIALILRSLSPSSESRRVKALL